VDSAFSVAGKRVAVAGAARSGVAAARLLARRGAIVTLSEQKPDFAEVAMLRDEGVALELGGHRAETFAAADLVVMSPGVPPEQAVFATARAKGVPIVSEIELASRWLLGRIVAITGTKGKSTTTTLIGRMLEQAGHRVTVGGNIGTPLSGQVDESTPDTVHVVEVSSFQLEAIETFKPWIAVMLNLSPDHLNRHRTLDEYSAAKARVFENQTPDDWAVVNADDPSVLELVRHHRARRVMFSRRHAPDAGTTIEDGWIVSRAAHEVTPLVPMSAIHLIGPHLVDDVMAAATVGAITGASREAMTAAVEGFRGLAHAMEVVDAPGHVRFVNDSKATNVDAALKSIESFERGLVVIMGGQFKGGDLRVLREPLRARATAVVAIGEATPLLHEVLGDVVTIRDGTLMDDAVRTARDLAPPGGVVLLAPACASFDMFRDYADRGDRFRAAVRNLA
jgi:UDP-N-acetylmuramoylalanine--D-glutamate ligase